MEKKKTKKESSRMGMQANFIFNFEAKSSFCSFLEEGGRKAVQMVTVIRVHGESSISQSIL